MQGCRERQSTPHREDFGPDGAAAAGCGASSRSGAAVWGTDRERCAAWKLTHPDGAGEPGRAVVSAAGGMDRGCQESERSA